MGGRDQLFDQPDFLLPVEDLADFTDRRVGITGARGTLGRVVSDRFSRAGLALFPFTGDITDAMAVERWSRAGAFDYVLHFAALVPVPAVEADPIRAFRVNALGAFNVAAATLQHSPSAWLFFASSSHVYAPLPADRADFLDEDAALGPSTLYGTTKLAGEQLVLPFIGRLGLSGSVGRIFSFGHRTQPPPFLVPSLLERIAQTPETGEMELRGCTSVRDVLDAESVIDAVLHLATLRYRGIVNIASGIGLTVEAIARHLAGRRSLRIRCTDDEGADALVANVNKLRAVLEAGYGG